MQHSRRQFVVLGSGAGVALLAGCVSGDDDAANGNQSDDSRGANGTQDDGGNRSANGNENDGGEGSCEPIELPLVDEPPHDPERPPDTDSPEEWNADYLGEGMDEESGVEFEQIELRPKEPVVEDRDPMTEQVFYAELLTSREQFEERAEPVGDDGRADEIDFDEEAVVLALSGFDSGSIEHEWVRAESNCNEVHLHGYHVEPFVQTDDVTTTTSGIVVERPEALERVWTSLTVGEDVRANVATDQELQVRTRERDDTGDGNDRDPVESVAVAQVRRESPGGWWSDGTDRTGIAVHVRSESQLRELVETGSDIDRFVAATEFGRDGVFLVETAAPDACYGAVEVSDVGVEDDTTSGLVTGDVVAVEDVADGGGCAGVITHPAALVRVESPGKTPVAEFDVTDGWGTEATVTSVPPEELEGRGR